MFKLGDTVKWKAAGKVSRLDGVKGQIVEGTVIEIYADGDELRIEKNYDSIVPNATLDFEQVIK